MEQNISIQSHSASKGFNWSEFFSFRKMITLRVIQVVYIIIALILTLACLFALFSGGYMMEMIPGGRFGVLMFLIFGNILWRIQCELIIVFFRINDSLSKIEDNTGKQPF